MPTVTAIHEIYLVPPNAAYAGSSVLANDSNTYNYAMNTWIKTAPALGNITLNSNGTFTYTANAGFTSGLDQFDYWVSALPDSSMPSARAYLIVGNVPPPGGGNRAPIIAPMAAQNCIEGQYVSGVQIVAIDPDGNNITYTAQGLPPGLTINAATGVMSGIPSYICDPTYNVTITVTDGNAPRTMNFTWNVADATIGTFKGTELNSGTAVPNSVTVSGLTTTVLYLSPGNTLRLEVFAAAGGNLPQWHHTLYSIVGSGATPASGNFNTQTGPNISFTDQSGSYWVCAGTDLNGTAALEDGEISHRFMVTFISFAGATVGSQRVAGGSGPVEPGLTSLKSGEHFEVGGNFKFEIIGGLVGPNSLIRYEIWKYGFFSSPVLATGSGTSFPYTFGEEEGGWNGFVRFYSDRNNDGASVPSEAYLQAPLFAIVQPRLFSFNVAVSDAVGGSPAAAAAFAARVTAANGIFVKAQNLLLSKDSENDWRAAVQFNVTVVGGAPFVHTNSAGASPDPVANFTDQKKYFNNLAMDVVFVNQLLPVGLRGLSWHNWHEILISYTGCTIGLSAPEGEASLAKTLAHEIGHGVGLYIDGTHPADTRLIMASAWGAGAYNEIEGVSDAVKYETGNPSNVKTTSDQNGIPVDDDADSEGVSSTTPMGSREVQLPILDLPGWPVVPSRVAELLWTYNDCKGDDWCDRPAHDERKSLLEGNSRGLPNVGPVKEHDAMKSFWSLRDPFDAPEDFPWYG